MKALDIFCGAGGAARGLMQAGLEVVGVDIVRQPRYPGKFIQADALQYLATADLSQFVFLWSSPPCQFATSLRHAPGKHRNVDLITPTRPLLIKTGLDYVIENVEQARAWLRDPVLLCGSMFGLGTHPYPDGWRLERHRLFETSFPLLVPQCQHDNRRVVGIYGGHFRDRGGRGGKNHVSGSNVPSALGYKAMGIPFGSMTVAEISDAIPPSYSRFIAEAWLRIRRAA
jgi:DNA (cytosine-5)-methyltransferase 1